MSERRTAWIDKDGDICLYLSDILFWQVRSSTPEEVVKWWESGEMPYPDNRGMG